MRSTAIRTIAFILVALLAQGPLVSAQDGDVAQSGPETLWYEAPALHPVRVLTPEGYDPGRAYPAVVALHGFASSATSFERSVTPFVEAGYLVVIPQGPYYVVPLNEPGEHWSWGRNSWTPPPLTDDPTVNEDTAELTALEYIPDALVRVREEYALSRVYVFGFSQGGVYAVLSGFYRRDLFDGIIAFGTVGIDRDWFGYRGDALEDGREVPVLLVFGTEDPYGPVSDLERARDLFREAGYDVTLHVFE